MTPDEQRSAIAQACGWKLQINESEIHIFSSAGDEIGWTFLAEKSTAYDFLPDYLNDLNAMHEAEKTLTPDQWVGYWSFLEPLTCHPNHTSIIHATAAQRAEAFLRTLNLWK